MPDMKNLEIAQIFREVAQILEIKGENVFRIRAYERAAQNIEGLTQDLEDYVREDRLHEIPGIGVDLSGKIKEYLETGTIRMHEALKKEISPGVLELLSIPSIGPKTAKLFSEELKIKGIDDLKKAIEKGKLTGIAGIKEKTIENILKGIEIFRQGRERMTLAQASTIADEFVARLKNLPAVKNISIAGSLRRQKETVRDIDILVISDEPQQVMEAFVKNPLVKDILSEGTTKSSIRTKDLVQVDCRVVNEDSFGAALLYFTGSKNFNIKIRQLGIKKGLKINEYGAFKKGKSLGGKTENQMFKLLDMDYVEPELREDAGEIELAQKSGLPDLITLGEIKGDLHTHSKWSDGSNTIEEMALAAKRTGYSYIALTDHSQSLRVAHGLNPAALSKKKKEIEEINKKTNGFKVLFGTEADIDSDGNIDYPDSILQEFDLVIAAIHTGFKQSSKQLTKRIISACKNKYVHIIAHPTGVLWGTRPAYELDLEEVFKAALDTNTNLEISAFPERLDLDSTHVHRAKELGVKFAINTDSHITEQLKLMKFGIAVARRGWLNRDDVINTRSLPELLRLLKK